MKKSLSVIAAYITLLKLRVMSLVIFTGFCGFYLAPDTRHLVPATWHLMPSFLMALAVGAGASAALNMWYERDIDALMIRTRSRPLPQNRLQPSHALIFGLILTILSVLWMYWATNWLASFLLAFTIGFYVLIYTMILKRTTSQNIVIGGIAGALPPVIGWAAKSDCVPLEAWILFLIIFFWTPAHFWALSMECLEDYQKANLPMLPLVKGEEFTKQNIVGYTFATVAVSFLPLSFNASFYYGIGAGILGIWFLLKSLRLLKEKGQARSFFATSIFYLFFLFLLLILDKAIR